VATLAQRGEKDGPRSFEWRELLKSARPLKFSPAVNYPKKEITGGFEASHPPLGPAGARSRDRSSRSRFSRVKKKRKEKKKKKGTLSRPRRARGRGSEIKN